MCSCSGSQFSEYMSWSRTPCLNAFSGGCLKETRKDRDRKEIRGLLPPCFTPSLRCKQPHRIKRLRKPKNRHETQHLPIYSEALALHQKTVARWDQVSSAISFGSGGSHSVPQQNNTIVSGYWCDGSTLLLLRIPMGWRICDSLRAPGLNVSHAELL